MGGSWKNREVQIILLKDAFGRGLNIKAACDYAELSRETYYKWIKEIPQLGRIFDKARADYAVNKLLPKVEEKEPWKLLKSLYPGEYSDDPVVKINIDARPLINVASETLLETLKQLKTPQNVIDAIPVKKDESSES